MRGEAAIDQDLSIPWLEDEFVGDEPHEIGYIDAACMRDAVARQRPLVAQQVSEDGAVNCARRASGSLPVLGQSRFGGTPTDRIGERIAGLIGGLGALGLSATALLTGIG
jgi:hypothetical protein